MVQTLCKQPPPPPPPPPSPQGSETDRFCFWLRAVPYGTNISKWRTKLVFLPLNFVGWKLLLGVIQRTFWFKISVADTIHLMWVWTRKFWRELIMFTRTRYIHSSFHHWFSFMCHVISLLTEVSQAPQIPLFAGNHVIISSCWCDIKRNIDSYITYVSSIDRQKI